MATEWDDPTESVIDVHGGAPTVRRFHLVIASGAATGTRWQSAGARCAVGTHPSNDLVLDDGAVSRFHCEIMLGDRGPTLRDLGSRNGTRLDGVPIVEGYLRQGSQIAIGRSTLRFELAAEHNPIAASPRESFGSLVGRSLGMRTTFALLERAAAGDTTVLLEGETGTGKEGAAEAIHAASARAGGPFVVVDCGSIPANLIESELFGHERGAFTGATERRAGAFEEAHGGTVFLDEIGELPRDMQPKLLRVLERREVRRVGSAGYRPVDVRIVAATHRDLRAEVNEGRFRADLYFRLAVLRVTLPPLRSRPDDIRPLAEHLLARMGGGRDLLERPGFVETLERAAWPGNVRELRNHLERCLALDAPQPISDVAPVGDAGQIAIDVSLPYEQARRLAIESFERRYVDELLARHGGRVAAAAKAAGIGRVYLYRLVKRHGG